MKTSEQYADFLISTGAIKVATDLGSMIRLRNGSHSAYYINHRLIPCNPEEMSTLVGLYEDWTEKNFPHEKPILACVDSAMSPLITACLMMDMKIPRIVAFSKDETLYGPERDIYTPIIKPHDTILVVDDVMTPNDVTAINVVDRIREEAKQQGVNPTTLNFHLLIGVLRGGKESIEQLRKHNITPHYIVTVEEVLQKALDNLRPKQQEFLLSQVPSLRRKTSE